jgi:hypothetical protein
MTLRLGSTLALGLGACLACGCGGDDGGTADNGGAGGVSSGGTSGLGGSGAWPGSGGSSTGGAGAGGAGGGAADPNAYLHADVWSIFWNDRTRCGAERTFLEICQKRAKEDCSLYQSAYSACNPAQIVYGQVGPEKQSESLCQRGKFPDVGGCVASKYDFDKLAFHWYGAEWQGNWGFATLKIFPDGADYKGGGELVALSSHPGAKQAAMSGIANHGLSHGCAMAGGTSGDARYLQPFGAFAWVAVPTGVPVTVVAAAGTNFADQSFAGCSRGSATQSPWVAAPPGSVLGCVYPTESVVFQPGKHYHWHHGVLEELKNPSPPARIVEAFGLPDVGKDVSSKAACAL